MEPADRESQTTPTGPDLEPIEPAVEPPAAPDAARSTPRSASRGYWRWFVAAALVAAAVAGGAYAATSDGAPAAAAKTPPTVTTAPLTADASGTPAVAAPEETAADPEITAVLLDASTVGEVVIPSVVTVEILGSFNGETGQLGSGSGVVYDSEGHILTNDHVVAAGSDYQVVLADGRIYEAELVGTDPTTDLAVLSVAAEDLKPIGIGNSDRLTVGEPAVAVGSPLGLDGGPSLTVGVISAFGREVQTDRTTILYGMLQTDAPITQGSSGGALVDGSGQLVGITTAVGVSDVGIEGIGFATPIEIVTRVADEIGIFGETALAATVDGGSAPIGVSIVGVEPETAAATAGLATDDVIAAINDDPVRTMEELIALLRRYGAGTAIEVTLDGGSMVEVTLGQRPPE